MRVRGALRECFRIGALPSFDVALAAAAIFADIRQTLQSDARISRWPNQVSGAVQAHQADSARFVDRHTRAAMRPEILAPTIWTNFIGNPQAALGVISNRGISLVKRRRGHGDFAAPFARRRGGARIDIVTAIAIGVPSYSHS